MRAPERRGWFVPPNDAGRDDWFVRDLGDIAQARGLERIAPFYVDADSTPNPGGWPRGGQTRLALTNDHLQYALTWFGLALTLLGVGGAAPPHPPPPPPPPPPNTHPPRLPAASPARRPDQRGRAPGPGLIGSYMRRMLRRIIFRFIMCRFIMWLRLIMRRSRCIICTCTTSPVASPASDPPPLTGAA